MSDCCNGHCHAHTPHNCDSGHKAEGSLLKRFKMGIIATVLLMAGIVASHCGLFDRLAAAGGMNSALPALIFFLTLCLVVSINTLKDAVEAWREGSIFNEFTLMILASAGAFIIGEYAEGVAVLLFYSIGEKLEDSASQKARNRIRRLLDKMPKKVEIISPDGTRSELNPEDVKPGNHFLVKPGERVPIDGILRANGARFDTSAITGESLPAEVEAGSEVLSGSIPLDNEVRLEASRVYSESSMSRLMKMVEEAAQKKSHTETVLRRITRWYTPLVIVLATLLFIVPWILGLAGVFDFVWQTWLERSLVLLVCSCPCALVVSVPLSYFAAIGAASRVGLLFKGGKFLDQLRRADTLLLDKTGTLTTGTFRITSIHPAEGFSEDHILSAAASLDMQSTHPLAKAIVEETRHRNIAIPVAAEAVSTQGGIKGIVEGIGIIVGSRKLFMAEGVTAGKEALEDASEICVAINGIYAGAIYLEDSVKPDAKETVKELHRLGFSKIGILSGDREGAVKRTAETVGADFFAAGMLPDEKHRAIERLRNDEKRTIAFVGDGINDAPALASASVGIAIGSGGTDVAIDSADAVLTGNSLASIARGVEISKRVHRVVIQNIVAALGIKAIVMLLGSLGLATLWAAVFADSGIMLLTVVWTLYSLRS